MDPVTKLIEQTPARWPGPGAEALIREARRRQRRRRRRTVGVIAAVASALAIGVAFGASGPGRSGPAVNPGGSAASLAGVVLRGSGTSVVVWPGTQCCDPVNTAYAGDLTTGAALQRTIPPMAGGDYTYLLVRVGRWLIYNGAADDPGVWALPSDLTGRPRLLGRATWFVPSAVPDQVWLVSDPTAAFAGSIRAVAVSTGRLGPATTVPEGTELIEGTDRGLLLLTAGDALELWQAGGIPRPLAHLEGPGAVALGGVLFAADARLVSYGTGCRNQEATSSSPNAPVGYEVCAVLRVIDLSTGRRLSFPAPAGTLGWEPPVLGPQDGAFSPANTMLAADAGLAPAGTGKARMFVLRLTGPSAPPRPVPDSVTPLDGVTAWSIAGSWLLYEGPGNRLRAFQATTGQARTLDVPLGQSGGRSEIFALISGPAQR